MDTNAQNNMAGQNQGGRAKRPRLWWAVLMQRCPRCRRGPAFRTLVAIYDCCPVCGFAFNREPGYFIGAMYFSYFLSVAVLMALIGGLYFALSPRWSLLWIVTVAALIFLPFVLVVFRYSRVMWMHFDLFFDPADAND